MAGISILKNLSPEGAFAEKFGTGLERGFERQRTASGLQALGFPKEEAYSYAGMDPRLLAPLLKSQMMTREKQTANAQRLQEAQGLLQNLDELQEGGGLGKKGRFWGGGNTDLYNVYATELEKKLRKIYPDIVVPKGEVDENARKEGLERIKARLMADLGIGMPQEGSTEQMPQAPQQVQQQAVPEEGGLAKALRVALGAGMEAAAPIAEYAMPGAGLPIVASDLFAGLENLAEVKRPEFLNLLEKQRKELGKGAFPEEVRKGITEGLYQGKIGDYLPTTQNIKKIVGAAFPEGYLEPHSKAEQVIQDAVSKGIGLISFGKLSPLKAGIATASGLGAKEFVKQKGGGALAQTTAELLFTLMPDVLYNKTRSNLAAEAERLYEDFGGEKKTLPIKIPDLKKKAVEVGNHAAMYQTLPTNKKLMDKMNEFLQQTHYDEIPLGAAITTKKEIGRFMNEVDLDRTGKKVLRDFNRNLRDTIVKESRRLKVPRIDNFVKANAIWHGLNEGESVVTSIKNLFKEGNYRSLTLRYLASRFPISSVMGGAGSLLGVQGISKGYIAGLGAQELYQTYKFFKHTPGAWKELAKAATENLAGHSKAAAARLARVDTQAQKWEKKNKIQESLRAKRGL